MFKNLFTFLFLFLIVLNVKGQFISDQPYCIETRSSGRFMNGKKSSKLQFYMNKDGSLRNLWKIVKQNDGTYIIKNYGNEKVLSVSNGSNAEGAQLITENLNFSDQQLWEIEDHYGFFVIKNKKSGKVVTVDDDYPATVDPNPDLNYAARFEQVGVGVQRSYEKKLNQEFEIEPVAFNSVKAISVPQLGWKPGDYKLAMLTSPSPVNDLNYTVKDQSGNQVMNGVFHLFNNDISNTWNFYYYTTDDLTGLSNPGNYTISCGDLAADFTIADDIFLNVNYVHGGTLKFKEIFNGFWKYNRYYDQPQELLEATLLLDEAGEERFTFTGNTYTLEPYGWFDAHSRDSKVARSAKISFDFARAYYITKDADNRKQLYDNIRYGIEHLLLTQNDDGSWPAGKIRDGDDSTPYDSRYYHWVINVDVNTAARCVKALIKTYNIFTETEPELAEKILQTAEKGWDFVINHEDMVDQNIIYRGYSADLLAAAIEMAKVTGEKKYFDKADYMITESKYSNGIFRKNSGEWPAETNNRFVELDIGCIPSICDYYEFAPTNEMKQKVKDLVYQFASYWMGQERTPQGVPRNIIDRTTNFGNLKDVMNYLYNIQAVALTFHDQNAYTEAKAAFNMMTGLNSFATSYIVGLGNKTPSLNFFKRSLETGIGAEIPGFTNTSDNKLYQDFTSYANTEGVAPIISTVFYILNGFNQDFLPPESPQAGDLKINEVKSNNTTAGASFIEIFNNSSKPVILDNVKLEVYKDNNTNPSASIVLNGILSPKGYYCVTQNNSDFYSLYGYEAGMANAGLEIDNNTDGFILKNNETVIDHFNAVPDPGTGVTSGDVYIRKGYDNDGTDLTQHWYDAGQNINGTPGKDNKVIWETEQNAEACDNYLWDVNGVVYTEPGTYTTIVPNVYGVDSVITLNLTVNINKNITGSNNVLCSDEIDAQYQWLDCDRNFEPIVGATERCFEPATNGNYAVEITKNGCQVTTDCYRMFLGIGKKPQKVFTVYPNPAEDHVTVELDDSYKEVIVRIRDIEGKVISTHRFSNTSRVMIPLKVKAGIYIIETSAGGFRAVNKVVRM